MNPASLKPIPRDTIRAARSVFNQENVYLKVGDQIKEYVEDLPVSEMISPPQVPADCAVLLAMITAFQFKEHLTDLQAAEAVRLRLEWKYALHLPLIHPGIKRHLLCNFRLFLHHQPAALQVFQTLFERLMDSGLMDEPGEVEASSILRTICNRNRLEHVEAAMTNALEVLVLDYQDWLRSVILPAWYSRYLNRFQVAQLIPATGEPEQRAEIIAADIRHLLEAVYASDVPELASLHEVHKLQEVLVDHFEQSGATASNGGPPRWRTDECVYYHPGDEEVPLMLSKRCLEN